MGLFRNLLQILFGYGAFTAGFASAECVDIPCKGEPCSLHCVRDFEPVAVNSGQVLLALKASAGDYPTFNVLRVPGPAHMTDSSEAAIGTAVLENYRRVGLADAELIDTRTLDVAESGLSMTRMTIRYSMTRLAMEASVAILNRPDRHYVLTLVDQVVPARTAQSTADELFKAFRLVENSQPAPEKASSSSLARIIVVWAVVSVVAYAAARWAKRSRPES